MKKTNVFCIKRLQQFVNMRMGYKVRVTCVKRTNHPTNRRLDRCMIYNLSDNGRINKATGRWVYADSIRRRYSKF